jgi:hypothetical protein
MRPSTLTSRLMIFMAHRFALSSCQIFNLHAKICQDAQCRRKCKGYPRALPGGGLAVRTQRPDRDPLHLLCVQAAAGLETLD